MTKPKPKSKLLLFILRLSVQNLVMISSNFVTFNLVILSIRKLKLGFVGCTPENDDV